MKEGFLTISNVLYCKEIPGLILSIGQMIGQLIGVTFYNNQFIIHQDGFNFHSFQRNDRWFLAIEKNSPTIDIRPLDANPCNVNKTTCNYSLEDLSSLWHQRLGHLSIRNLNQILKYNTADGIHTSYLQTFGICHPCSIAKSEHRPVKNASRSIVQKPGDVVVVDLIGPLPVSINHMKYVLMIQDVFSKVVVAIPISDKSDTKLKLQNWMTQFMNVTNNTIRVLLSDNGTEFKNNLLEQFLVSKGIVHKFSMPYEHHQNGRIERTNRTISEMARTMLHASNLPVYLWPWAF
ncbi:hypothetical protein O181_078365 [Austropuccinia psidii MF-1]|uniref:Integrase catalytic domain-containing protein n=1 Tax=Austropuccinia psidii MF-1 TaxID=1389203 RepID=A0A9Q3FCP6_9BASI|nr:hypothetical protein [Austropuccinia psidii MF-1]